jgi:hypothetical protein
VRGTGWLLNRERSITACGRRRVAFTECDTRNVAIDVQEAI